MGAELAAAQNVSPGMALAQAHRGVVLADRLPKVAALFEAGRINEPLVRAIECRTDLVTDPEAMAQRRRVAGRTCAAGGRYRCQDRTGHRRPDRTARPRRVAPIAHPLATGAMCRSAPPSDEAGYHQLWARLFSPDAAVLKQRVAKLARPVCEADPRTQGERRAEALVAVTAGLASWPANAAIPTARPLRARPPHRRPRWSTWSPSPPASSPPAPKPLGIPRPKPEGSGGGPAV